MSDFDAFLQKHKINLGSLDEAGKREELLSVEEHEYNQLVNYQRARDPITATDRDRIELSRVHRTGIEVQAVCNDMCANLHDTPYLTPEEGVCFRNCNQKYWQLYPGLNKALQGRNSTFLEAQFTASFLSKLGLAAILHNPAQAKIDQFEASKGYRTPKPTF